MTTRSASLDLELITRLRDALPVPLVLHGSSGVPDDALIAAISAGITKINIGTALNVAFTGAVREHLAEDESVDPRRYLSAARDAATTEVERLLSVLRPE
jgi:fructose-bisphosphate aldolase class II